MDNLNVDYVSVIIPTFNRFKFLLTVIESIKLQTYNLLNQIEIIVVNDCSTEKEYYEYNWKDNGVTIVHLNKNSKELFGYACAGYVRNIGIGKSTGKYIAFCDDDDMWFPLKIELQLDAIKKTGCKMSSTDGLIGKGTYNSNKSYEKYNEEYYYSHLKDIYKNKGSIFLDNGFPEIWNKDFLKINNCIITSSVLIEKEILNKINNMRCLKNGAEDYDCWLRALEYTNNVYVREICFYYDAGHGYGRNF
jgi:teichuronic acid biosynthesis glycosyltransferase TuaG